MSLSFPASHCPDCGYKLKWYDNVPVVSYCILGGKCRSCRKHISFRYTTVELANMLLWLLSAFLYKDNAGMMALAMISSSVCLCICFIDLENMIIPDRFQIILGIAAVATIFFDTEWDWISHLIGGVGGGVVFYTVALIVGKIKKCEALGGGDIKLAAVSGLMLGWQRFLLMILISSVSASIVMLIRNKKSGENEIAENEISETTVEENNVEESEVNENNAEENEIAGNDAEENNVEENEIAGNDAEENNVEENEVEVNEDKEMPFAPFLTCGLLIALFAGSQIIRCYVSLLIR